MPEKQPIRDQAAAFENMVIFRDVLAGRGARPFLSFGTLLGAVRERGFIPYDDDVDFGILESDREAFLASIPELAERGLVHVQAWSNGRYYAFRRKDETLDLFVARPLRSLAGRRWDLDTRASVPALHLDALEPMDFLGRTFFVPAQPEALLRNLYGRNWRVPIEDCPSRFDFSRYAQRLLRDPRKIFYFIRRFNDAMIAKLNLKRQD